MNELDIPISDRGGRRSPSWISPVVSPHINKQIILFPTGEKASPKPIRKSFFKELTVDTTIKPTTNSNRIYKASTLLPPKRNSPRLLDPPINLITHPLGRKFSSAFITPSDGNEKRLEGFKAPTQKSAFARGAVCYDSPPDVGDEESEAGIRKELRGQLTEMDISTITDVKQELFTSPKDKDKDNKPTNAIQHILGANLNKSSKLREEIYVPLFILLPDDTFKVMWDLLMILILAFLSIVVPYRVCFTEVDSKGWKIFDIVVDSLFCFDILLNFFTAYYDDEDELITGRKNIAVHYIKTWFFFDSVAILPLFFVFMDEDTGYENVAKLAKLPRLYRIVKIVKLAKIISEKDQIREYLNEFVKISAGAERLLYFGLFFFLLCHWTSCLWYLMARLEEFREETWVLRIGIQDCSKFDIYLAALYWSISTVTTVGYGDINAATRSERLLAIIIMFIGVGCYSFAIGSLSSVISNMDSKTAKLKQKLQTLNDLKQEFRLPRELYSKLKKALKYDHNRNISDKSLFMTSLPNALRLELSLILNKDIITRIPFFSKQRPQFIAYMSPFLKHIQFNKGQYIYSVAEHIEGRKAAYVMKDCRNMPYLYIDEGDVFGDSEFFMEEQSEEKGGQHSFTVRAIQNCEILFLSKDDLFEMDEQYIDVIEELFKNSGSRYKSTDEIREEAINYITNNMQNILEKEEETQVSDSSPKKRTLQNKANSSPSLRRGTLIIKDMTAFANTLKDLDKEEISRKSSSDNSSRDSSSSDTPTKRKPQGSIKEEFSPNKLGSPPRSPFGRLGGEIDISDTSPKKVEAIEEQSEESESDSESEDRENKNKLGRLDTLTQTHTLLVPTVDIDLKSPSNISEPFTPVKSERKRTTVKEKKWFFAKKKGKSILFDRGEEEKESKQIKLKFKNMEGSIEKLTNIISALATNQQLNGGSGKSPEERRQSKVESNIYRSGKNSNLSRTKDFGYYADEAVGARGDLGAQNIYKRKSTKGSLTLSRGESKEKMNILVIPPHIEDIEDRENQDNFEDREDIEDKYNIEDKKDIEDRKDQDPPEDIININISKPQEKNVPHTSPIRSLIGNKLAVGDTEIMVTSRFSARISLENVNNKYKKSNTGHHSCHSEDDESNTNRWKDSDKSHEENIMNRHVTSGNSPVEVPPTTISIFGGNVSTRDYKTEAPNKA